MKKVVMNKIPKLEQFQILKCEELNFIKGGDVWPPVIFPTTPHDPNDKLTRTVKTTGS